MTYDVSRKLTDLCALSLQRLRGNRLAFAAGMVLMFGCRSDTHGTAGDLEFVRDRPESDSRARVALGERQAADVCTISYQPATPAFEVDGPIRLTLRDATRVALATNPELVAIRQQEPVGIAAVDVARTYPFNPQVSVDVRPYTRERNGDNAATLVSTSIQQELELAHQGRYRARVGEAELDRTHWTILQAEVTTIVLVEQRYFGAVYQRQRLDLATSLADMNQQLLGVLQRRFEAGQATATDVSLARIQIAATQQQVELVRAAYETSLNDLRTALGLPATVVIELVGDLEQYDWRPIASSPTVSDATIGGADRTAGGHGVSVQWLSSRPDIRAAESDVDAARARLELACASRTPNLKIGPVYEHDESGTQFLGIEASMPLPVLNTGGPLVRQRYAELHQRVVALEQLQHKAKLEVQAALERYARAKRAVEVYAKGVSPELSQQIRVVEDQFNAGQTDLLRVYSARTSLIQSRQMYLDSLQELARAAASLTAATGLGPDLFLTIPEGGEP